MAWLENSLSVTGAEPIRVLTWETSVPGPVLAVLGGVHGDEPEGVLAANTLTRDDPGICCGTLVVVPIAHPAAYIANSRCCPEGGNLARAFPGRHYGAAVQRVAAALVEGVLSKADALVDLHTAGREYNMPFLAGYMEMGDPEVDQVSRAMATAFGADLVWRHPDGAPGRTLSVMRDRAKPAIYVESPGGGSLHAEYVARYIEGVRAILSCLGMKEGRGLDAFRSLCVRGPGNLDQDVAVATADGIFEALVVSGTQIEAGQKIGAIHRPGFTSVGVKAPKSGVVMYLRSSARVTVGLPLLAMAEIDEAEASA